MTATQRTRGRRKRPGRRPSRWVALRDSDRIRWSRVLTAQARVAAGYYDRADVREFLVDAVLEELARN